jgi:hypothetical protein
MEKELRSIYLSVGFFGSATIAVLSEWSPLSYVWALLAFYYGGKQLYHTIKGN